MLLKPAEAEAGSADGAAKRRSSTNAAIARLQAATHARAQAFAPSSMTGQDFSGRQRQVRAKLVQLIACRRCLGGHNRLNLYI